MHKVSLLGFIAPILGASLPSSDITASVTLQSLSTTTEPLSGTSYPHRKLFSFSYDSDSNDDLEVDVQTNPNDATGANEIIRLLDKRSIRSSLNNLSQADEAQEDDIVYVTKYAGDTLTTVPIPMSTITATSATTTTTTLTASNIIAPAPTSLTTQTVTQYYTEPGATITVTATSAINTGNIYQQGFNDGYKQGEGQCSSSNERVFQTGYMEGAYWAYGVGYNDGSHRYPYVLPSFVIGGSTGIPEVSPRPVYPSSTVSVPPPPPPPSSITHSNVAEATSSIQYTTISYYVPYGGNPYRSGDQYPGAPYPKFQPGRYEVEEEIEEPAEINGDINNAQESTLEVGHSEI